MPWKYLRITRRCTCVTPDLTGKGKMNQCSGSGEEPLLFCINQPLPELAAAVIMNPCPSPVPANVCQSMHQRN